MVVYYCIYWFWLCTIAAFRIWELKNKYFVWLHMLWMHLSSQASPLPRLGPRLGNAGCVWGAKWSAQSLTSKIKSQGLHVVSIFHLSISQLVFWTYLTLRAFLAGLEGETRVKLSVDAAPHTKRLMTFFQWLPWPFRRSNESQCKNPSVGQWWQIRYNSSFVREFGFSAVLVAVVAAWFDPKYLTRSSSIALGRMGPAMLCPAVPQKLGDHPAPSFQVLQSAVLERLFYGVLWDYGSFRIISHRPFLHARTVDGILVSKWTGRTEFFGVWSSESLKQIGFRGSELAQETNHFASKTFKSFFFCLLPQNVSCPFVSFCQLLYCSQWSLCLRPFSGLSTASSLQGKQTKQTKQQPELRIWPKKQCVNLRWAWHSTSRKKYDDDELNDVFLCQGACSGLPNMCSAKNQLYFSLPPFKAWSV